MLADRPDTVNSTGLPVHLSGLSWCDGYGEPVERHQEPKDVASVAGAFFACSRVVWERLGGMDESYFMYHEDTDLSLRCHLAGLRVVYCPDAVALHAYDFSRNAGQDVPPRAQPFPHRARPTSPPTCCCACCRCSSCSSRSTCVIALRDGWGREKVRAWGWLLRHAGTVRAPAARVQAQVRDVARPRRAARAGGHPDPARPAEGAHPAQPRADARTGAWLALASDRS